MGCEVIEVDPFLNQIFYTFKNVPSPLEQFCLIYNALSKSEDPDLQRYLKGKGRRVLELTDQLNSYFSTYGRSGAHLFDISSETINWQHSILKEIFVQGPWKLPSQLEKLCKGDLPSNPVYCFGVDFTPLWSLIFAIPNIEIFLFSPCQDFWEDLCSYRERKKMVQYLKKRGVSEEISSEMDSYLREGPQLLANLGKVGRKTLKILNSYDLNIEEIYPEIPRSSLLKSLQSDLLNFKNCENLQKDGSIQVFLTGSSPLKEIECLRDEILKLQIPFHEIVVLSPNIEPFVPLIEFVFEGLIPYRISGFDISSQSSFKQGLDRILSLSSSRWSKEDILTLFETPSFYRKKGWDEGQIEIFEKWIESASIHWGIDYNHRNEILVNTLGEGNFEDHGSWEKGLDSLLDTLIYLRPRQVNPDQFKELLSALLTLQELSLRGEKTMPLWADCLEKIAEEFLFVDGSSEADSAAQSGFIQFIQDLRKCRVEETFSLPVIQSLMNRPCYGQIHGSHLHAVQFSPIDQGSLLPAKALFLIGMDEESFPRSQNGSSLDLLKGKGLGRADEDRYLFLQTLFSAKESLRISFGHLSQDEGKPVGPSLLVQELMSALPFDITTVYRPFLNESSQKKVSFWPQKTNVSLPKGEIILPISELRQLARHPWKFYLQKVHGMYLTDRIEQSFALQKGALLRSTIEKPIEDVFANSYLPFGKVGEALQLEITEKALQWQTQLNEWDLKPFSLILKMNCESKKWEDNALILPPLEVDLPGLKVHLIGEIQQVSLKGLISTQEDNVAGLLKVWPEALIAGLKLEAPHIWMLKNGKCKNLEKLEEGIKAFVSYYFSALVAPSPLLPDWADPFLRKGVDDLAKKIEKGTLFEDPIVDWVLARTELPAAEELYQEWGPIFKETFGGLASLYPSRGKSDATV